MRSRQIGWSQESNLLYQILRQVNNLTKQFSVKCSGRVPNTSPSGAIPPRQIGWSNESELLWEIARELNRTIAVAGTCGNPYLFSLKTFLGDDTPGYPVGVWNVNNVYLGTAADANAYATLWNSDPANQAVATITAISPTSTSFGCTSPTDPGLRALRYYTWRGPSNVQIYVGQNDIIKYGSTTKFGSTDTVLIQSDTVRDWNRPVQPQWAPWWGTKIPNTTVRRLTCTGYSNNTDLNVFHNEDTEYWGNVYSFGFYYIAGNVPKNTKALCAAAAQFNTNYNLVTNWQECTSLWSFPLMHSGGGPWRFEDAALFPNLYRPAITQLSIGQMIGNGNLLSVAGFINQTNYPNVSELTFGINSSTWSVTGQESWFLNMPKVNRYFGCVMGSTIYNPTSTTDLVWNNIATNLTGITPVVGSQARLYVSNTTNVSAASLVSRTYLAAQGWTVQLS